MKDKKFFSFNSLFINSYRPLNEVNTIDHETLMYHYTSPDAIYQIISKKSIRFTDIEYFNDRSENVYLVKCILDFLDSNSGKYKAFAEAIKSIIKTDYDSIRNLDVSSIEYDSPLGYKPSRKFVFCASQEPDLLCMWNYYLKNGSYQGYNIGFNMEKLLKTFDTPVSNVSDPFSVMYGAVIYNAKDQLSEIEELARNYEKFYSDNVNKNVAKIGLLRYIQEYGSFFKSAKFKHEKEYRIVIGFDERRLFENHSKYKGVNNKQIEYDFTSKNGIIVPYLKVIFNEDAVSRLYISPILETDIAKKSISDLLKMKGYKGVQIHKSKIPIRY